MIADMLRIARGKIERMEAQYKGITRTIEFFEAMEIPACPACKSDDTASVQVGVIGRTINLCAATTKFKLLPNSPTPGRYFCNACTHYFDGAITPGSGSLRE